jgi:hypothetical protein
MHAIYIYIYIFNIQYTQQLIATSGDPRPSEIYQSETLGVPDKPEMNICLSQKGKPEKLEG